MSKSMYEITGDLLSLNNMLDEIVDEEGNPREPTEDERKTLEEWFNCSKSEFETKFDNICKFIKNLKIEAEIADGERKAYKGELDRLSKRAKALENRASNINGLLWFSMQRLGMKKYKTALFSAGEQNTQLKVESLLGSKLDEIPEEFLKPRELDTTKIKEAIKSGRLVRGNGTPLGENKVFFAENGKELKDVRCMQGQALIIR
jgi:hypothetical protein